MTEYNVFCFSKKYNDENSFQQNLYRAFNVIVGEERYHEIKGRVNKILGQIEANSISAFWKKVTIEQWNELLSIPEAKNFKEGFEYISGVKIKELKKMTLEQVCEELGYPIEIIK